MRKMKLDSILKTAQEASAANIEESFSMEDMTEDYIFSITSLLGQFGISKNDTPEAAEAKIESLKSYFGEIGGIFGEINQQISELGDSFSENRDHILNKFKSAANEIKEDMKDMSEKESLAQTISLLTTLARESDTLLNHIEKVYESNVPVEVKQVIDPDRATGSDPGLALSDWKSAYSSGFTIENMGSSFGSSDLISVSPNGTLTSRFKVENLTKFETEIGGQTISGYQKIISLGSQSNIQVTVVVASPEIIMFVPIPNQGITSEGHYNLNKIVKKSGPSRNPIDAENRRTSYGIAINATSNYAFGAAAALDEVQKLPGGNLQDIPTKEKVADNDFADSINILVDDFTASASEIKEDLGIAIAICTGLSAAPNFQALFEIVKNISGEEIGEGEDDKKLGPVGWFFLFAILSVTANIIAYYFIGGGTNPGEDFFNLRTLALAVIYPILRRYRGQIFGHLPKLSEGAGAMVSALFREHKGKKILAVSLIIGLIGTASYIDPENTIVAVLRVFADVLLDYFPTVIDISGIADDYYDRDLVALVVAGGIDQIVIAQGSEAVLSLAGNNADRLMKPVISAINRNAGSAMDKIRGVTRRISGKTKLESSDKMAQEKQLENVHRAVGLVVDYIHISFVCLGEKFYKKEHANPKVTPGKSTYGQIAQLKLNNKMATAIEKAKADKQQAHSSNVNFRYISRIKEINYSESIKDRMYAMFGTKKEGGAEYYEIVKLSGEAKGNVLTRLRTLALYLKKNNI